MLIEARIAIAPRVEEAQRGLEELENDLWGLILIHSGQIVLAAEGGISGVGGDKRLRAEAEIVRVKCEIVVAQGEGEFGEMLWSILLNRTLIFHLV